jgi:hypothetical protein
MKKDEASLAADAASLLLAVSNALDVVPVTMDQGSENRVLTETVLGWLVSHAKLDYASVVSVGYLDGLVTALMRRSEYERKNERTRE